MQNRRILDAIAYATSVSLKPKVSSNSFLGVASYLRLGRWCAIVSHSFRFVFGDSTNLVFLDMIDPVHRQTIGLFLVDRSPQSPMSMALQDCVEKVDIERRFDAAFESAQMNPVDAPKTVSADYV